MNTATLSLTPLLRQSVGFDRFNDLFESALRSDDSASTYPPYNIEKRGEDDYTILMAVPGFSEQDLSIVVQNSQLIVSGRLGDKQEEGVEYLHRGIITRAFERTFRLADHMQVTSAEFSDGLLRIALVREIPEEAKPRMIPIKEASPKVSNETRVLEEDSKKKAN
jgi:molecular chaperone IbpA